MPFGTFFVTPLLRLTVSFVIFLVGKLKQSIPTQAEIRQVERVRSKVPTEKRVYPQFLFTANLIQAQLVDPAESKYTCLH